MSRRTAAEKSSELKETMVPPRERIVSTATELFREHGIRGIGVEAIADAALTNKMTLYRHFGSKDELICETLRRASEKSDRTWQHIKTTYADDPKRQLLAWVEAKDEYLSGEPGGCDLANAAVELKGESVEAKNLIIHHKAAHRTRLAELCREAGSADPDLLADTLLLLLEGARVSRQTMGSGGCCMQFAKAAQAAIASLT